MTNKIYDVKKITKSKSEINGFLVEAEWLHANIENRFIYPWENKVPTLTEFRALYDDNYFYFFFYVHDKDIVIEKSSNDKSVVNREDRVELFFAKDEKLKNYYCIEIDPLGRVLSYSASYYRKFDFSWVMKGLLTTASMFQNGYTVEGAIPLKVLQSLGVSVNDSEKPSQVGVFRADFSHGLNGKIDEHWISWIDPGGKTPDFHVPNAFGHFRFVNKF